MVVVVGGRRPLLGRAGVVGRGILTRGRRPDLGPGPGLGQGARCRRPGVGPPTGGMGMVEDIEIGMSIGEEGTAGAGRGRR